MNDDFVQGPWPPDIDANEWWMTHGHPAMKAAGFRRSGRKYTREQDGTYIILRRQNFQLRELKVLIEWGIVPPSILECMRSRNPKLPLNFSAGLFSERLSPPMDLGDPSDWSLWNAASFQQAATVGTALAAKLTDVYEPIWGEIITRDGLLAWLDRGGLKQIEFDTSFELKRDFIQLVLDVNTGDPEEIMRLVDRCDAGHLPRALYLQWARERLTQRLASLGS